MILTILLNQQPQYLLTLKKRKKFFCPRTCSNWNGQRQLKREPHILVHCLSKLGLSLEFKDFIISSNYLSFEIRAKLKFTFWNHSETKFKKNG